MNNVIGKQPSKKVNELDSFEKGRLFETFIIQLFNDNHFRVKEWRKSIRLHTVPFAYSYPDIEFIFMGKKDYHFAIECKWKAKFSRDKHVWIKEDKLSIYRQFQLETRLPVFIAIGIGGQPSNPEKLFVTPLERFLISSKISASELMHFERKTKRRFFYDTIQLKLF